jgi:hypothetical protein
MVESGAPHRKQAAVSSGKFSLQRWQAFMGKGAIIARAMGGRHDAHANN